MPNPFHKNFPHLHPPSIDCEYPVECDDEYWDTGDPETSWKQPEGKPSFATCSVFNLRLLEILTFALKHLYCTARSRISMGHVGPEWEKKIAAQLDAAMNKWIDELPEHRERSLSRILRR